MAASFLPPPGRGRINCSSNLNQDLYSIGISDGCNGFFTMPTSIVNSHVFLRGWLQIDPVSDIKNLPALGNELSPVLVQVVATEEQRHITLKRRAERLHMCSLVGVALVEEGHVPLTDLLNSFLYESFHVIS